LLVSLQVSTTFDFKSRREKKPLNHAIENQHLERFGNKTFRVGAASMQGKRENMEDAHSVVLDMKNHPDCGFFAVFDGHNGTLASRWCAKNVPSEMAKLKAFVPKDIEKKMIELDSLYLKENCEEHNGTTAVFAIVQKYSEPPDPERPFKVIIGNLGDSRCIVGRPKQRAAEVMTEDHKPSSPAEEQRILSAGGEVARGRVGANLAVSRAIGDHAYKKKRFTS